jgi:hypothetical protein
MPTTNNNSPDQRRRRARQPDGQYKGDNPIAPEVNDAWEPVELAPVDKAAGKYSVKPKVTGQTKAQEDAGKYSNKQANSVRPTFGNISTNYH